jgi:hypothetical protein
VVTNTTKSIPNRTIIDELEEFVLWTYYSLKLLCIIIYWTTIEGKKEVNFKKIYFSSVCSSFWLSNYENKYHSI